MSFVNGGGLRWGSCRRVRVLTSAQAQCRLKSGGSSIGGGASQPLLGQTNRKRARKSAPRQQQKQVGIASDLQASLQRLVAEGQLGSRANTLLGSAASDGAGASVSTEQQSSANEGRLQKQTQQEPWIYVTNVGLDATADKLTDHFSSVGHVRNVTFVSRFAATVEFEEARMADAAIEKFDNSEVDGKTIRVRIGYGKQDQHDSADNATFKKEGKAEKGTANTTPPIIITDDGHGGSHPEYNLAVHKGFADALPNIYAKVGNRIAELNGAFVVDDESNGRKTWEATFEKKMTRFLCEEFPVDVDLNRATLELNQAKAKDSILAEKEAGQPQESVAAAAAAAAAVLNMTVTAGVQELELFAGKKNGDAEPVVAAAASAAAAPLIAVGEADGTTVNGADGTAVDNMIFYEDSVEYQVQNCESTLELVELFGILGVHRGKLRTNASSLNVDLLTIEDIVVIMKHLNFLMTNRLHKKIHTGKVTVLKARIQSQLLELLDNSTEPADLSYNASFIARSCFDTRFGYSNKSGMPFHLKVELCEGIIEHGMNKIDEMNPKSLSWFVFALGRMYADLYSGWPLRVHGRVHQELPAPFRNALYAAIVSKSKEVTWDPQSCSRLIVALPNLCSTHPSPEVVRALVAIIQQAIESESFGAQATTRIAQTFALWAEQGWLFNTARMSDDESSRFDEDLVQCLDSLTWKADEVMEDFMPGQLAKLAPALAKIQVGAYSNTDNYVSISFLQRVERRIATIGASLSGNNIVDFMIAFDEFNVRPSARTQHILESALLSNEAFTSFYHLEMPHTTAQSLELRKGPGTMRNVLSLMKHAIGLKASAGQDDPIAEDQQGYDLFEEDGVATEAVGLPLNRNHQHNGKGRQLQLVEMSKYLHACASLGIMLPNRKPQLYNAIDVALGDLQKIVKGTEGVRVMPTWYLKNTALDANAAAQLLWALSVFNTIGTSVCAPLILGLLLESMAVAKTTTAFAKYPHERKEAVLKDAYKVQLRMHEVFTAISQLTTTAGAVGNGSSSSNPDNNAVLKDIVSQHGGIVQACRDTFAREQALVPAEHTMEVPLPTDTDEDDWGLSKLSANKNCTATWLKRKEFQELVSEIEPSAMFDAAVPDKHGGHGVAAWVPSKGIALEFYGPYSYTISTDPKQRPRLNGAAVLKERALVSGGADLSGVGFYEWSADDIGSSANDTDGKGRGLDGLVAPFPAVVEKIGVSFAPKTTTTVVA